MANHPSTQSDIILPMPTHETARVTVNIDGLIVRTLEIKRSRADASNGEDPEAINRYQATIHGNAKGPTRVTFEHRYGDDVLTMISKAIDALGGHGGPELGR